MSDGVIQTVHYALSVLGALGAIFMLLMRSQFISRKEFEEHKVETEQRFNTGSAKMSDLTTMIARVEATLLNLPTKDDVHKLALAMKELGGDIKSLATQTQALGDELDQVRATLTRHEDIIAQGGRS